MAQGWETTPLTQLGYKPTGQVPHVDYCAIPPEATKAGPIVVAMAFM